MESTGGGAIPHTAPGQCGPACSMSAFGPKRTCTSALHMSAFGCKANMTVCGGPLSRSLLGVKRTWFVAAHMSAFDPKRTSADPSTSDVGGLRSPFHKARLYRYDVKSPH